MKSFRTISGIASLILFFAFVAGVKAQETFITVRAKAKDAKFLGTSMGGARIVIRNAGTGKILAEGITEGGTGNTSKIMKQAHERNKPISEEGTAAFTTSLELEKPVFVTVEGYAPLNSKQAAITSSTQLWLLPGKNITGDGIVLEFPGFVVDILSPQTHEAVSAAKPVEIKANIVMMCGCPITDGGIWNANQYEIKAVISSSGNQVKDIPLKVGEKSSTFFAETRLNSGVYEIMVYAFDPVTGNSGLAKTNVIVK
ncbi:hypothetical protein RM553_15195 [Zunongwangia sp. F363]|uniref:Uncharacterized protein n=1 Tax=Autumnicola tepida TaxID=3075595 RepID=A0ABU3CCV7_9FLAO|nr:hypothetical protein [Zunongwangia sp. F363]MDT0644181.1 hypothetical protein [Zunongwangia sp. F363]